MNKIRKNKYKSIIKEISLLIAAKKKKEAIKLLPKFNSQLMKMSGLIRMEMALVTTVTSGLMTLPFGLMQTMTLGPIKLDTRGAMIAPAFRVPVRYT